MNATPAEATRAIRRRIQLNPERSLEQKTTVLVRSVRFRPHCAKCHDASTRANEKIAARAPLMVI